MMRSFISAVTLLLVSFGANGSQVMLQKFFVEVKTLEAKFEQKVVDETGMMLEITDGNLTLSRPGKFRWDYSGSSSGLERGPQIIADGESILMYDPDLEQVTQRSLQDALGQVPSLLLVQSGADIEQHFIVTDIGMTDSLSWVSLKPLDEDAGYQHLMIGFQLGDLNTILLLDGLGNETRLSLSEVVSNSALPKDRFEFEVPDGVDVLSE